VPAEPAKVVPRPPRRRPLCAAFSLLTLVLVVSWGVSLVYSVTSFRSTLETSADGQERRHTFVGLERGCIEWGSGDGVRPTGVRVGLTSEKIAWLPTARVWNDGWSFAWPLWTLALPALAVTIALWWPRRKIPPNACPSCGYDVRASADKCPECGAAIGSDPARPT